MAVSFWIDKYPEIINQRFSKSFITEALLFVLENNIFHFNDEYFKQMIGTAMGTDVAPTFSTLTVRYSEIKLYNLCEQNWGVEMRNYVPENGSRFLYDCEIRLDQKKVPQEKFLEMLNSINISIQYTMEKSETELPFLDILIKQDDLYRKPTDTRRYVPFSSNHPRQRKKNIPFTLVRRICANAENNIAKQKHLEELKETLWKQEYPMKIIEAGINKALSIPQDQLRQVTTKAQKTYYPLSVRTTQTTPKC